MFHVAIVEDNHLLAKTMQQVLAEVGVRSDLFHSASEADAAIGNTQYAALIIDLGVSNGEGLTVLRALRAVGQISPCLMLTGRDELRGWSQCLESGVDDVLSKPFAMHELVARVRRLLRRAVSLSAPITRSGDITVDPRQHAMRCANLSVQLARAELQIMLCLMKAGDQPVGYNVLRQAAWGAGEAVTENALEVAVHRLRKKLAAIGTRYQLASIRGVGFVLLGPDEFACDTPQPDANGSVI